MVVVDRGDRGAALVATQRRQRTTQRSAAQRSAGGPGHDDETPCRQTHTQHSSDEQCVPFSIAEPLRLGHSTSTELNELNTSSRTAASQLRDQ